MIDTDGSKDVMRAWLVAFAGMLALTIAGEGLWLGRSVAPAFVTMFSDFGDTDLPPLTKLFAASAVSYVVTTALGLAAVGADLSGWRYRRTGLCVTGCVFAAFVALALPVVAFTAFYLPLFEVAHNVAR